MPSLLVVDDSATDRSRIVGLLSKRRDCKVSMAANGKEALEGISETSPDVVLTDLQMPEMDGLELIQQMKERYPQIPVIVLTGKGSEEIAVQAISDGASGYVNKSIAGERLMETVDRVLTSSIQDVAHAALLRQMSWDRYQLSLENDRSLMSATARFISQAALAVQLCPEAEVVRVAVALEEALLNACLHGNLELDSKLREGDGSEFERLAQERSAASPWQERRVTVTADVSPGQLKVDILDEGPGFNPDALPDPTDPENLLKPHGRGVVMMKLFLDDVHWNEQGNQVTLVKNGIEE